MFAINNNHPIIPRKTELILNPHYVTFHSNDRDIQKYPSSSEWSIKLPQSISKIFSMTLYDMAVPVNKLYVFKKDYQNLAFMVFKKSNHESENSCEISKCTLPLNFTRPLEPHINYKQSNQIISNQIKTPSNLVWNQFQDPTNCTNTTVGTCTNNNNLDLSGCCNKIYSNIDICNNSTNSINYNNNCIPTKLNRSNCVQQTALIKAGVMKPPQFYPYSKQGNYYNSSSINHKSYPFETFENDPHNTSFMIRIPEGSFTGIELAEILQSELNSMENSTQSELNSMHSSTQWYVIYKVTNNKFYFLHNSADEKYFFDFQSRITYQCCDFENKNQPDVFLNPVNWGLGYYLGFEKLIYSFSEDLNSNKIKSSTPCSSEYQFKILLPTPLFEILDDDSLSGLVSCSPSKIKGESVLYMEVNKFNNVDEIYPDNTNSNSTYTNTYQGIIKSAFAKLDIHNEVNSSRGPREHYVTHMKNQFEDRIDNLNFKFRFHDGRYVYFDSDFNFSIEFNSAVENPMANLSIKKQPSWDN